jgi:hypothetical protein
MQDVGETFTCLEHNVQPRHIKVNHRGDMSIFLAVLLCWLILAAATAVVISRIVSARDRQVPSNSPKWAWSDMAGERQSTGRRA